VGAVDAWLAEHGILEGESIQRSPAGDWVTIQVPVSKADEILDTVSPPIHPFLSQRNPFHLFFSALSHNCVVPCIHL
jgi:hypothetical protein